VLLNLRLESTCAMRVSVFQLIGDFPKPRSVRPINGKSFQFVDARSKVGAAHRA
jgi:hypothetical protein